MASSSGNARIEELINDAFWLLFNFVQTDNISWRAEYHLIRCFAGQKSCVLTNQKCI